MSFNTSDILSHMTLGESEQVAEWVGLKLNHKISIIWLVSK